jgi:hypothetical protein
MPYIKTATGKNLAFKKRSGLGDENPMLWTPKDGFKSDFQKNYEDEIRNPNDAQSENSWKIPGPELKDESMAPADVESGSSELWGFDEPEWEKSFAYKLFDKIKLFEAITNEAHIPHPSMKEEYDEYKRQYKKALDDLKQMAATLLRAAK